MRISDWSSDVCSSDLIASETVPNYAFKQMPAIPGQGVLDWTALLPAAKAAGVTGWYVEQEGPFAGPRLDAVRANYANLAPLAACSMPMPRLRSCRRAGTRPPGARRPRWSSTAKQRGGRRG